MKELEDLKKKEEELKFLKDLKFNTEVEFKAYYSQNEEDFNRLRLIQKRIKELEWRNCNAEERYSKRMEILKLSQKFGHPSEEYKKAYVSTLNILYESISKTNINNRTLLLRLVELLYQLENEPFMGFDFERNITNDFNALLKSNYNNLFKGLKQLSFIYNNSQSA